MPFRLVIFDFDGTLADTSGWFAGALNEAADRFGFRRVGHDELEALRSLDNRAIVARLGVPMWKLPAIARHIRKRAAEDCSGIRLFDGIGDVLERCRMAGREIAIVSSNGEGTIRQVLGPELAGLVSQFACSASMFGKPGKFRRVVRTAGVLPHQAIAIGDEVRDIDAAAAAGILSGVVAWGYAAPGLLRSRGPDFFFESVEHLGGILAGPAPLERDAARV